MMAAAKFEVEELEASLPGTKRMRLNFGPQHPATHGTLRNVIELDGEIVVSIEPEIGFLHHGFEKHMENLTYEQCVVVTDRMNYMSAVCNNIGFALAVEKAMGITVTPRCARLRTIMYELGRIADHIICNGLQAMDLGAFSVMLWAFIEREKVYDIFEYATGGRLTTSFTRIGGLWRDVDDEELTRAISQFLEACKKTVDEMEKMLATNPIFLQRTRGIGKLSLDQAIAYGITGPLLRASGGTRDLRKDQPYLDYPQFDFKAISHSDGDVFARFMVRLGEMRESIKIIEQALKNIPKGSVTVDDPRIQKPPKDTLKENVRTPLGMYSSYSSIEGLIYHFKHFMFGHAVKPPPGETYFATESPNGELGYYIISDGTEFPVRVRVRPPSFYNYQVFPVIARNHMLTDIVAILSSINVIAGELDR